MTWSIEFSAGWPGDPWMELSGTFRTLEPALAFLRHMSRSNPIDSYRVVDSLQRVVISITPGHGGAA